MKRFAFFACLTLSALTACNNQPRTETPAAPSEAAATPDLREETVTYQADTATLRGFAAYDANARGSLPVVLVIPEWWGLNDYVRSRARQLAALGYFAFVADMYGNGTTAANPQEAQALAGPFYQNPALGSTRVAAALARAKTYSQADTTHTAAIGYCFGGAMALNAARLALPFDGVVSFHGGLAGPAPVAASKNTRVLVLHGADDSFVPAKEIDDFKKQMEQAGVNYKFVAYPGATHAFTNPDATATGQKFKLPIAYNPAADSASWQEMRRFFSAVLGK